jgi:hypothetical protein
VASNKRWRTALLLGVFFVVAWAQAGAQAGGGGHGTPPPKKTRADTRGNITPGLRTVSKFQP